MNDKSYEIVFDEEVEEEIEEIFSWYNSNSEHAGNSFY